MRLGRRGVGRAAFFFITKHGVLPAAQFEAIIMRRVVPIHVFEPFDFETINQMQSAFTEAVAIAEGMAGGTVPDSVREALALRIIECAQRGTEANTWVAEAIKHWQGHPAGDVATGDAANGDAAKGDAANDSAPQP
jgi:hypothetical protein